MPINTTPLNLLREAAKLVIYLPLSTELPSIYVLKAQGVPLRKAVGSTKSEAQIRAFLKRNVPPFPILPIMRGNPWVLKHFPIFWPLRQGIALPIIKLLVERSIISLRPRRLVIGRCMTLALVLHVPLVVLRP